MLKRVLGLWFLYSCKRILCKPFIFVLKLLVLPELEELKSYEEILFVSEKNGYVYLKWVDTQLLISAQTSDWMVILPSMMFSWELSQTENTGLVATVSGSSPNLLIEVYSFSSNRADAPGNCSLFFCLLTRTFCWGTSSSICGRLIE